MPIDKNLVVDAAEEAKGTIRLNHPSLNGMELNSILDSRFDKWTEDTVRGLAYTFPFKKEEREIENTSSDLEHSRSTLDSLRDDVRKLRGLDFDTADRIEKRIAAAKPSEIPLIHEQMIEEWKEELERQKIEWMMKAIESRRNSFVYSLEKWLRFIESASRAASSLNLKTGILWDLTDTDLTENDTETMEKWSEMFRKDPNTARICEMLGRMCSFSSDENSEEELPVSSRSHLPDCNSREELAGVELGRRIEDVVPSELGLLKDPDLEILFDQKFVENRIMCFSKQGYVSVDDEHNETKNAQEQETICGPIVFCIDTSGSMTGTPEYLAKAFTFYSATHAMEEGRDCFLINFSTGIDTLNLTMPKGMKELVSFLGKSFKGGTDIKPALTKAIEMTSSETYRLADIIVISDFVMPPDSFDHLKKEISEAKDNKCRFHSLTIGNFIFSPDLPRFFDECWQYDPSTGRVTEKR